MNSPTNRMARMARLASICDSRWWQAGLALLVGSLLVVPVACSTNGNANNPNNSLIVISPTPSSDKPEQVTVNSTVGAQVLVELPFSAGTGYSWSMSAHSEGVELVGKPETKALNRDLPGGPMLASFKLTVTAAGRQTARLELARAWETDTPAARTVNIVIIASETP